MPQRQCHLTKVNQSLPLPLPKLKKLMPRTRKTKTGKKTSKKRKRRKKNGKKRNNNKLMISKTKTMRMMITLKAETKRLLLRHLLTLRERWTQLS